MALECGDTVHIDLEGLILNCQNGQRLLAAAFLITAGVEIIAAIITDRILCKKSTSL